MLKSYLTRAFDFLILYKKHFIALACVFLFIISLRVCNYSSSDHYSDSDYEDYFNDNNKIFKIRIPKNLNFAGESVPTDDKRVRSYIERELVKNTYWQAKSLVLHKRASRWFPLIEPILKKNNIPDDFKYIALVESQLSNVVSPRGAAGFWQIIESTALGYGLEITPEVDERYHLARATEAACKYFNEAYKQFGNWTLVAASYNLGMNGIQNQLNKQDVDSYYQLKLTEETGEYVYRILAMKEIISRPKIYGFNLRRRDALRPFATKTIAVDYNIDDLSQFAEAQGINILILKYFNPWLRANTLTIQNSQQGLILKSDSEKRKKYGIDLPLHPVTLEQLGISESEENCSLIANDSGAIIDSSPIVGDSVTTK